MKTHEELHVGWCVGVCCCWGEQVNWCLFGAEAQLIKVWLRVEEQRRPSPRRPPREKGCGALRLQHEPRAPPWRRDDLRGRSSRKKTTTQQRSPVAGTEAKKSRAGLYVSQTRIIGPKWTMGGENQECALIAQSAIPEAPLFGLLDGRDGRVLRILCEFRFECWGSRPVSISCNVGLKRRRRKSSWSQLTFEAIVQRFCFLQILLLLEKLVQSRLMESI